MPVWRALAKLWMESFSKSCACVSKKARTNKRFYGVRLGKPGGTKDLGLRTKIATNGSLMGLVGSTTLSPMGEVEVARKRLLRASCYEAHVPDVLGSRSFVYHRSRSRPGV
jgi:hypothetical protein